MIHSSAACRNPQVTPPKAPLRCTGDGRARYTPHATGNQADIFSDLNRLPRAVSAAAGISILTHAFHHFASMQTILRAPAKINLTLQVLRKRPDGYHDLRSLMCPVRLSDRIELHFGRGPLVVDCNAENVPNDETNLACRAAQAFDRALPSGLKDSAMVPCRIVIDKTIPVGAGLGGGSSDAAAVLLGLNRQYGNPLSTDDLIPIGRGIGADVPFFLIQGPALAEGIGDRLRPVSGLIPYYVLIVYPGICISTKAVFQSLNLRLTSCEKRPKNFAFRKRFIDSAPLLCNDLEHIVAGRYPEIDTAKKALLDHGAAGALMSGSGSAVFGLFQTLPAARRARQAISALGLWQTFLTEMVC
jgi:4-diphosphocytidyl-2-C-methyl-D-erythritol kinase